MQPDGLYFRFNNNSIIFGVKLLKLFYKSSLKSFLTIFCNEFQCFVCLNSFFIFFCSLQEDRSFYRMTRYVFYVSNAEQ